MFIVLFITNKLIDTNTDVIKTIKNLKDKLDHSYLNDIKEIKTPTLENIGSWIWKQVKPKFKNLHKVEIERKTCGESFSISN